MLQLEIKAAKDFFFVDKAGRQRIFAGVAKARHKALTRAGAMIRTVARNSIRRAKRIKLGELSAEEQSKFKTRAAIAKHRGMDKPKLPFAPSNPGEPPRSRTGLLKKFIYFAFDSQTKSVVVGPAILAGTDGSIPGVLEYGGTSEGSQIAARPYMRPAEQELRTKYVRLWQDAMM